MSTAKAPAAPSGRICEQNILYIKISLNFWVNVKLVIVGESYNVDGFS